MIHVNPARGSASSAPGAGRTEPSVVGGMVHALKGQIDRFDGSIQDLNE